MKAYSNKLSYITVCFGFIISALVAWSIDELKQESVKVQLEGEMKEVSHHITREMFVHFEALYGLQGLFSGSTLVTQEEFNRVASDSLSRLPELDYLEWAPIVAEKDRAAFEQAQKMTAPGFRIQEPMVSDAGRWVRAKPRREHYPVVYHVNKGTPVTSRMGADLAANTALNEAISRALETGSLAVTEPLMIKVNTTSHKAVLAVIPVYQVDNSRANGSTGGRYSDDLGEPTGVIVGRFTLDRIMLDAMSGISSSGLHVALMDTLTLQQNDSDKAILFSRHPVTGPVLEMQQHYIINNVGGRGWQLVIAPSENYMNDRKSELSYVVLMAGLLISGLLAAYLRLLSRRSFEMSSMAQDRHQALKEANKKLAHLSQTDGLTHIANRRFFDESFIQEWRRGKREQHPVALVLFDLDFFKQYNDQYGHLRGDECLRNIAELIGSVVNRPGDLFARFGGEEFILLLPNTPEEGAMQIAEQCRELVESIAIPHHKSSISEVVTISVGVCSLTPDNTVTESDMLDLTDQALYCAKDSGRNCVVSANEKNFTPREDGPINT